MRGCDRTLKRGVARVLMHLREFPEAVLDSEELWLVDIEEALAQQGSTALGEQVQWLHGNRGRGHPHKWPWSECVVSCKG